jgi:hypothetical protein
MQGNLSISPVNGDHVIFNFVDRTIELPDPHPQYLYADHEILFKAMPTLRFRPVNDAYCKSYVEQDCKTTEALYHAAHQLDEWDDEVEDDEICIHLDSGEDIVYIYEDGLLTEIQVEGDCNSYVCFDVIDALTLVPTDVGPLVDCVCIREWIKLATANIPT